MNRIEASLRWKNQLKITTKSWICIYSIVARPEMNKNLNYLIGFMAFDCFNEFTVLYELFFCLYTVRGYKLGLTCYHLNALVIEQIGWLKVSVFLLVNEKNESNEWNSSRKYGLLQFFSSSFMLLYPILRVACFCTRQK